MSPVNQKGLYHGCKHISVYLLVSHSTIPYTKSLFFSNHDSNHIQNLGTQPPPKKAITHVLEPTYIPRALNTGTCISCLWRWAGWAVLFCGPHTDRCWPHTTQEKLGRGLEKNGDEWTRGVKISKKEVPGSSRRMHVYTLTCSRLKRE